MADSVPRRDPDAAPTLRDYTNTLRVGDTAPDFDLPRIDGSSLSLDELKGAVSAIVFFRGTW